MKYIAILLFVTISFWSCKENVQTKDFPLSEIYTNDSIGFSIQYPASFEAFQNINNQITLGMFEKNEDTLKDFYRENVMLYIEMLPVLVPFNDYITAGKTELKLKLKENVEIFDEDSLQIDDMKTASYKIKVKRDSLEYISKYYIIPRKAKAFNFSCTSTAKAFEQYEQLFDKIIASFKVK